MTPTPAQIEAAWKSESTLFIIDTNVLLNLYGFEEQTRQDFFSTTDQIGQRLWIPFHVGLEYNKHRLKVISKEKKVFRDLKSIPKDSTEKLQQDFNKLQLDARLPQVYEASVLLINQIKNSINAFNETIDPWDKKQPDVRSEDEILNRIHAMTADKIGAPPEDQAWLDKLYKDGEFRYSNKIPPGFRDRSKEDTTSFSHNNLIYKRQYGDLIIWKQILSEAEARSAHSVIFITDDAKDDWWSIVDSGGSKTMGPHEELRREMYNIESVTLFHMYSTSDFLAAGNQIMHIPVSDSSISDATVKPDLEKTHEQKMRDFLELLSCTPSTPAMSTDEINRLKSYITDFEMTEPHTFSWNPSTWRAIYDHRTDPSWLTSEINTDLTDSELKGISKSIRSLAAQLAAKRDLDPKDDINR